VSNLERGLDMMEELLAHPEGLGVTEIAANLGIPKNAAFRIASALHERGYLARSAQTQRYRLSPRLMAMGYRSAESEGLIGAALPYMKRLRDAVGETAVLCAVVGEEGLVLDHVPGVHPFRFVVETGMRFHLHASAPGKAIMAFLPDDERKALVKALTLKRFNERTITTRGALRKALVEVRSRGYSLDLGEEFEGVRCAAAPVLNAKGYPVAALNVTGPAHRFAGADLDAAAREACAQAAEISRRLGLDAGTTGRPPGVASREDVA
jgi:IclR family acetate operon transcriptional repressor